MNTFKKYLYTTAVFIAISIVSPIYTYAQPVDDPPDPSCDPLDPACPIDGGVSFLIAAGIAIGAKKAYEQKNKKAVTL